MNHTYSQYVDNSLSLVQKNGIIGGVRISKIEDYSGFASPKVRNFYYTTDLNSNQSSGILLQKNNYLVKDYKMPTTASGVTVYQNYFSITPIIYLSNLMGSQIEYSSVIEKDGNGSIWNKYYSYLDYPDYKLDTYIANDRNMFDPHTEFGYKRGKIKQIQYINTSGEKLKQEDFIYQDNPLQSIRAFSYKSIAPCAGTTNAPIINGASYNIYYSDDNLSQKKIRTYRNDNTYLEEVQNYNYTNNGNFGDIFLQSKSITNSNDQPLLESYKYTFNKTGTEPYTTLTNRRVFPIIETSKTLSGMTLSSSKVDYGTVPIVDINNNITSSDIFSQIFSESKGSNALEQKLIIDKYDVNGNIRQAHNINGNYFYYYYAYGNRFPYLKIEGPQILPESNINYGGYIPSLKSILENTNSTPSQIFNQQSTIINSFPNHMLTFYTFDPNLGVVTSITKSNKQIEYYNYDKSGRLISVKDQDGNLIKDYTYEIKAQ